MEQQTALLWNVGFLTGIFQVPQIVGCGKDSAEHVEVNGRRDDTRVRTPLLVGENIGIDQCSRRVFRVPLVC